MSTVPSPTPQDASHFTGFSVRGPVVTVTVGSGVAVPVLDFQIHRTVITLSPYLKPALEGHSPDAEPVTIHLEDDDPDVFNLYAIYLYRDIIAYDPPTQVTANDNATVDGIAYTHRRDTYRLLVHAYLFGTKIRHYAFVNKIMDEIARLHGVLIGAGGHHVPLGVTLTHLLYENDTLPGSAPPLKRFINDTIVYVGGRGWMSTVGHKVDSYNKQHLVDLTHALLADKREGLANAKAGGNKGNVKEGPPYAAQNWDKYHM